MKKLFATLLSLSILFTLAVPAFAAGSGNVYHDQFRDVPSDSWFAPYVQSAYECGLMSGTNSTTFNPSGSITYAEALALACRFASVYTGQPLPQEDGKPWYQVYVDYGLELGFLSPDGYRNRRFGEMRSKTVTKSSKYPCFLLFSG